MKKGNWALMHPFDIWKRGEVYLHRIRVLQTPWFGVYLHDINTPDYDDGPHNHPWVFLSIILRGGYSERVYRIPEVTLTENTMKRRKRFSVHGMGRTKAHRITYVEPRTKTLILTGSRHSTWGFFTPDGFVRGESK